MKILQINKFFYLKGGSERYFFDLADLLSQNKEQVFVFSMKSSENFDYPGQENFVEEVDLSKNQGWIKDIQKAVKIFWNKEAAKKLEKIIIQEKPDLAHLHNFFGQLSPSIIYTLKKYQIPIVITLHDYKWMCPNYTFFSQGQVCYDCLNNRNYRNCLTKKCIKNSYLKSGLGYLEAKWQKDILKLSDKIDFFIAPSRFIKNKLKESGIESSKIKQIPNFINRDWIDFKDDTKTIRPYFLYFGRLSQEKGIQLLINAFLKIAEDYPNWDLKIAGEGPEYFKIAQLAEENAQIQMLGQIKGKNLKSLINQSYAVVVPSLWPENFPYTVLESFALAKPVIAAKTGGLIEMLNQEKNGLLFKRADSEDLKEKLIWAIKHFKKMQDKGKAAQMDLLKKYQPSSHYEKISRVYQQAKTINAWSCCEIKEPVSNNLN